MKSKEKSRNADGIAELVPTLSFKIGFANDEIPTLIRLFGVCTLLLSHLIPNVRQCFKCDRLGRTLNRCRATVKKCLACGKPGGCQVGCKGVDWILSKKCGHRAWNVGQCQVWKKDSDILKLMTVKKLACNEVLLTF